jgi:hypothetical protein
MVLDGILHDDILTHIRKLGILCYLFDIIEEYHGGTEVHVVNPTTGERTEILEPILTDVIDAIADVDPDLFYHLVHTLDDDYLEEAKQLYQECQ